MSGRLDALDTDLAMCVRHLNETGNTETRLGGLFVGFALGHIYAEYQKSIHDAIIQRAKKSGDIQLARYVEVSLRRLGMGAGILRQNILAVFCDDVNKSQASISKTAWKAYDDLIETRNKAMHGADISEGLDDVMRMHRKAREVVYVIRTVLLGSQEYGGVSSSTTTYNP